MKNARGQMNYLISVCEGLDKFQNKKVTDTVRKDLRDFLNGLDKELFIRVNVGKMISVRIKGMPEQLAEVIVIQSVGGRIWINCDSLWGTIEGLNEQIQEAAQYLMAE